MMVRISALKTEVAKITLKFSYEISLAVIESDAKFNISQPPAT